MTLPQSATWTPARLAELRHLFDEGLSYDEIGRRMGLSKNTVLGKAHRLGFDMRAEPTAIQSTTISRLDALDVFPRARCCLFPIGDPGSEGFRFCGAATADIDHPYCGAHEAKAFISGSRASGWSDERKEKHAALMSQRIGRSWVAKK